MFYLKQDKYGSKSNIFKVFPLALDGIENFSKKYPFLHIIMFGNKNEKRACRVVIGVAFGLLVGMAFYEWVLMGMSFDPATVYTLGLVFTTVLTMGCAVSSQIRCIILLTIPSFCGRAGRHIVQGCIITAIMAGPLPNILSNTAEIMRMYTCTNSLAHNLSRARYDLLVRPFKVAFLQTKLESEELKDIFGSVSNVVEPFAQEIEGVDDVKLIQEENDYMDEGLNDTKRSDELEKKYPKQNKNKETNKREVEQLELMNGTTNFNEPGLNDTELAQEYQNQYFKKLEMRCENVKTGMGKACVKRFSKFKEKCEDAVHWSVSWAICWPMKLDVICDIVKSKPNGFSNLQVFTYGGYDCDPSSEVSGSIGKGYFELRRSPERLKKKVSEERTQFKVVKPPYFVGLHSVVSITNEFTHEIKTKKTLAFAILSIVRTFLAFMFILVICSALNYHKNYLHFTDFDNMYITSDFRVLDARRHKYNKLTLLPQIKCERKKTVDPYSLSMSSVENKAWGKEFLVILAFLIICFIVIAIDAALIKALLWIHDNLEFSYSEEGLHKFKIDVGGIGFIASLVRSIIKGFDFHKELKGEITNKDCLPKPKRIVLMTYVKLLSWCALLCGLTYFEGYLKRLKRSICAFYYRDQEKTRIETFYRKSLSYRRHMFKGKLDDIAMKAKKNELMYSERLLYRLYLTTSEPWSTLLKIVTYSIAGPVCVICNDGEPMCKRANDHKCERCNCIYCTECWMDFKHICYYCFSQGNTAKEENLQSSAIHGV